MVLNVVSQVAFRTKMEPNGGKVIKAHGWCHQKYRSYPRELSCIPCSDITGYRLTDL